MSYIPLYFLTSYFKLFNLSQSLCAEKGVEHELGDLKAGITGCGKTNKRYVRFFCSVTCSVFNCEGCGSSVAMPGSHAQIKLKLLSDSQGEENKTETDTCNIHITDNKMLKNKQPVAHNTNVNKNKTKHQE